MLANVVLWCSASLRTHLCVRMGRIGRSLRNAVFGGGIVVAWRPTGVCTYIHCVGHTRVDLLFIRFPSAVLPRMRIRIPRISLQRAFSRLFSLVHAPLRYQPRIRSL